MSLPPAQPPRHYQCLRAPRPLEVLAGRLDKPFWRDAPWTDDFIDIEGDLKPMPPLRTRAKMLWDEHCFYFAAEMEEPHVWATLTERDSVIFHDNDFEIFLNPSRDARNYYEFEINALNTVWDLLLRVPYREGGQADNSWFIKGLRTAVHVDGTLNDPSDVDQGWSVEVAMPFAAFDQHQGAPCPPRPGDQWLVNFSRVEWDSEIVDGCYRKTEGRPEHNWVWSPMGLVDMHLPLRWGTVRFSDGAAE